MLHFNLSVYTLYMFVKFFLDVGGDVAAATTKHTKFLGFLPKISWEMQSV